MSRRLTPLPLSPSPFRIGKDRDHPHCLVRLCHFGQRQCITGNALHRNQFLTTSADWAERDGTSKTTAGDTTSHGGRTTDHDVGGAHPQGSSSRSNRISNRGLIRPVSSFCAATRALVCWRQPHLHPEWYTRSGEDSGGDYPARLDLPRPSRALRLSYRPTPISDPTPTLNRFSKGSTPHPSPSRTLSAVRQPHRQLQRGRGARGAGDRR